MKIKFEYERGKETPRPPLVADALILYAFDDENGCCNVDDEEAWAWVRSVVEHLDVELRAHQRERSTGKRGSTVDDRKL